MRNLLKSISAVALAFVFVAFPLTGKAAALGNKTMVAFTQPVAIPGMVLAPGAYIFKTSDVNTDVIQVYDATQTHLLTTAMTVPSYRSEASSKNVVTFEERPAGTAPAIGAFYAADQTVGREFVYDSNMGAGQ